MKPKDMTTEQFVQEWKEILDDHYLIQPHSSGWKKFFKRRHTKKCLKKPCEYIESLHFARKWEEQTRHLRDGAIISGFTTISIPHPYGRKPNET